MTADLRAWRSGKAKKEEPAVVLPFPVKVFFKSKGGQTFKQTKQDKRKAERLCHQLWPDLN